MKEKLYTIPLNDAMNAGDECPFCFIERNVEQDLLDFVLGSGSSYMESDIREQTDNAGFCRPHFKKMFDRKHTERQNPIGIWVAEKERSCYICNRYADTYERYLDTFFVMYKKDPEFRDKVANSKGFCLHHFGDLCEGADSRLNDKEKAGFYEMVFPLMEQNMARLSEDVSWLVEKFDYRNKDADWKNSKDAIQRGMQKLKGGYPADPPYKMNK